ncbi:MAG: hypothetical protein J7K94_04390 [Dehalococcoidia bacterium]|nr:hypothetical protein [Dehalococcoidia bacterium]
MNWMRYTALGIGIAFGLLFLVFAFGEGFGEYFSGATGLRDYILLACGPISMILATLVAIKRERIGGWWLVIAGIISTVLFTFELFDVPETLLITLLIYPVPMVVAGFLFLIHDVKTAEGDDW